MTTKIERPAFTPGDPTYQDRISLWVEQNTTLADSLANGNVRCECGCKYWVGGKCFDCDASLPGGVCPNCGTGGAVGGQARCKGCDYQLQWDLMKMFTPGANPVAAYDDGKVSK